MQDKEFLREKYKRLRSEILDKSFKDNLIQKLFLESDFYKNAKQVFIYMALDDEIDTSLIINKAFSDGKFVAIPKCVSDVKINFYYINSLEDAEVGFYGIREPKGNMQVLDFSNGVIVVPGLTFDISGNRVGYGKGYYDRFLFSLDVPTVGLCYEEFLNNGIRVNKYDKQVDFICTQKRVIVCKLKK